MGLPTLLGLGLALALDAGAVAVAASLQLRRVNWAQTFRVVFAFGGFQFLMPLLGWATGTGVSASMRFFHPWAAFILLLGVGGHMLWDSFRPRTITDPARDPTRGWTLGFLALATSLDAYAVGLSFAFLEYSVWLPATVIGLVTAVVTAACMRLGSHLGRWFGRRLDAAGGLILIALGVKILLEHL